MSGDSLHIVAFPWLAFGHMLPFLELCKALAKRGHRITYISTPRNIQRLPQIQPDLAARIRFLPFPLPPVENLPDTSEATSDISFEKSQYLKIAFDALEAPFSAFLKSACADENTTPDWVVMDFAHHWVPKIAEECRIPCALFSVYMAPTLAFFGPCSELNGRYRTSAKDFTVPPKWIPFPSNLAFRLYEAKSTVAAVAEKNASGMIDLQRVIEVINGSKFVCVRSCHSLDSKWLSLVSKLYEKDVVPVGLLPPHFDESSSQSVVRTTKEGELDVMDWLDQQPEKSVVYIAFGSESVLSSELLHELALGIEMSKVRFLWALRKPANTTDYEAMLPDGFEERTKEFGVVVTGWVPQMSVLAHASIGAHLTHCGWSSAIENFQFGHPLVLLPLFFDQGLNARYLEELEVGVAIQRDEETGNFGPEDVAKVVRFVMADDDGGKAIRRNATRIKEVFADQNSHEKHVDELVEKLKMLKQGV